MPPQQTNVTSGIEADAEGRGLNVSIVSARDAMDATLAARLKATATALDYAFPEKDAAASTRSVLGLLRRFWRAFQGRRQRQSLRANLQDLSDRELMDIGLTRSEIDYITAERAIDRLRDSTIYLWSRGVM
jgi:uncharacterized protein YjiS (DUF1127 family)